MSSPKALSDIFGRFFIVAGYLPALALLTLFRWLILRGLPPEVQSQISSMNDTDYFQEISVYILIPVFIAAILVGLTANTVRLFSGRPIFKPGNKQSDKYTTQAGPRPRQPARTHHAGPRRHPRRARLMADMRLAAVAEVFRRLRETNPHPTTELEYASPSQHLVAVVLSTQSTDKGVNIATRKLFALAPTPEAMMDLGEAGIAEQIKTIGLYRNKAKNTALLSRQLVERHRGEVPKDREALEALPGVGRKTANVVLNTAFGEPTIAVDTHIFGLGNRTGIAKGKTVLEVEQKLLRVTPDVFKKEDL